MNETIHAQQRTFREGAHHLTLTYKLNDAARCAFKIHSKPGSWSTYLASMFDIGTPLHANVMLHVTCDEQRWWMWSSRALIQPPIYLLSCRNVTELLRIDVVSVMVHLLLASFPGCLSQPGNEASLLWPQVVYLRSTIATLVLVDHKKPHLFVHWVVCLQVLYSQEFWEV